MKFSHLYEELKLLDICKPVSPEEAKKRDIEGSVIKLKELIDNAKKTKLPDGTWHVHDNLDLSYENLTTLKDLNVSIVDYTFYCQHNKLTSLEGCPKEVRGNFSCAYNEITSLEGCPKVAGGDFDCDHNQITSLKGCPTEIGWSFYCNSNNLASLKGCPKKVTGNFLCNNNSNTFTESEVSTFCDVGGMIIV